MDSKEETTTECHVTSDEISPKNKIPWWTLALILSISLARIGSGLFISIHGPTLLSLADNVGTDVGAVSWVFSGRSAGVLIGGIATGYIMERTHVIYSFGIACVLLGGVVIATPWIYDLWLLIVTVLVGGLAFGYLDAGMQALVLQIWGERDSRPHIAAYHFTIAVGAFLAPIIAQPFLQQENSNEDICPASSEEESQNTTESMRLMTTEATLNINPLVWPYMICGIYLLVIAIVFVILGCFKLEQRVRKTKEAVIETRNEDNVSNILILFALVCVYYFFCVAGETAYQSYIYSVSICSALQFNAEQGTWINSVYWLGFGSGRLAGIFITRYLRPRTIIIIDFCGTITTMTIVSIFGENNPGVTWAVSFLFAFFQATVYSSGVSWTSKYTNMSGHYIFIFSIGQAMGSMILLPLGGWLFELDPFNVMYMILCSTILNAVCFGFMLLEIKRMKAKVSKLTNTESMASTKL